MWWRGAAPDRWARYRPAMSTFDVDWVVIGSGFGGSVAALRLTEKGH
jgi:hypothetical protein